MSTVFKTTLRPILVIEKLIGFINLTYTLESNGLLIRNVNLTYYTCLEITRIFVLLMCTYTVYIRGYFYVQQFRLLKFWTTVMLGRISEVWIIKLINGIIEFDERFSIHLSTISVRQQAPSNTNYNIAMTLLFVYYIGFVAYHTYLWPPFVVNITSISSYIFGVPYIADYAVVISVCFYLNNLASRFQALNDQWKRLPDGLIPAARWRHSKILESVENIRLLHAQLSELVKIFSLAYGLLLSSFFVFVFIDMVYIFYLTINHEFSTTRIGFIKNFVRYLPIHIFNIQCIIFMMSIIVAASWINEKRIKIISSLRLIRISYLPADIKQQVKMFMNQISILESDQVSTYGFFTINLNLVISILILLMTGLATLIQMKNNPIMRMMINNTKSFHKNWVFNSTNNE